MKKYAFVLLGLFLAGMAITCIAESLLIGITFGVAFATGSWHSFRAAGRHAPAPPDKPRPWER
jgi:hypothetical protein